MPVNPLDNSGAAAPNTGDLTVDKMLDILNTGDDDEKPLDLDEGKDDDNQDDQGDDKEDKAPKPAKKDKEDSEDSGEEKEDAEADEEDKLDEEKEPTEDELDTLITPVSVKQLKAEYPEIFKKFPFFEKVIFREKAFTEVFPTVQDAKDAVEQISAYKGVESEIFSGSTESILKAVKDNNPRAFEKIVNNYIGTLAKVDQNAFHHTMGNVVKQFVLNMHEQATQKNDENLKNAALVFFDFMFPGQNFTRPSAYGNRNQEEDNREDSVTEERKQFQMERFQTVGMDLQTGVKKQLRATIDNNIDRKGVMTPFVKRNAITEVENKLETVLKSDRRFSAHLTRLWQNAERTNFNTESIRLIRSAYLGKARAVLGDIIKVVRNEALKGSSRKVSEDTEDKRGPISQGRPASPNKVNRSRNDGDRKPGESVADYFMRD